jgi:hypothetical protein
MGKSVPNLRLNPGLQSLDISEAAAAYVAAGCKVIVLYGMVGRMCSCGDTACGSPGKHPVARFFPRGVKSATADLSVVKKAIGSTKAANLAIPLTGLTVVDVDGDEGLERVSQARLGGTLKVKTGRGSHQYYLGEFSGRTFKGTQFDILTGGDHYVVVPPSIHRSGKRYSWAKLYDSPEPTQNDRIDSLRRRKRRPELSTVSPTAIAEGGRNDTLFRIANALRARVAPATLEAVLRLVNERDCYPPLGDPEVSRIALSSARYGEFGGDALFGPPNITTPLPMEFLWYPYLPRFGLTMLAGDPGRGKSLLVSLLIGCVTSGTPFPMSDERLKPGRVLLLSAEDNWERVTLPRLLKHGTDVSNLHHMFKFRALTDERLAALAAEMRSWKPDLVVVDTISAYMGGGRDMHRQNEVGEFLAQLNEMAEETGAAILALGHLNKSGGENPLYRIVGSIGFAASIRSAIFFGADPDDADRLALAHGKANASEKGKTIVLAREGGGRDDIPILKAVGYSEADEYAITAAPPKSVGRPSVESEQAREFILSNMTVRPQSWSALVTRAEARSLASSSTMVNVRTSLVQEGVIEQVGSGPKARWRTKLEEGE